MRVALPALEMTAVEDRSRSTDRPESGEDGKRDESPKHEQSNVAIYVSIAANIAIAATNLVAAGVSGSSAMVARGASFARRCVRWDNVLLGIAAVFDGSSFIIALRALRQEEPDRALVEVVRRGKDPSTFTVVLEDIADLTGLAIAFLGVWLGHRLANPYFDGVASIGVGLVLAAVALVLVGQSRKLLVGERASEEVLQAVRDAADDGMIEFAECPLSMQLGPNEVLLGVTARFAPHLSANEVATAIQRFEDRLRKARPDVKYICVEPIPQQAQLSSPTPIAR